MLTTKKRCLVTGGAGFIGSHLVDELLLQGHTVTVIDNLSSGSSSNMTSFKNHPNLSFIKADIRNFDDISAHFKHIDWVFHLAGLADIVPSIENPKEYYWEEVKDDYLEIWFSTDYRNKNPFQLEIVTNKIRRVKVHWLSRSNACNFFSNGLVPTNNILLIIKLQLV